MTPLHFGESTSPLFGILSEPSASAERGHGVVLCPPIAQEHVRSHWALRQLAQALVRAGYHVLRFDWFGVGDSAGTLGDASVERWLDDAVTASQELRDATGLRRVSLVGLRLGALLAALASKRVKPAALVLWDPPASGRAWFREIEDVHAAMMTDERRFWNRWPAGANSLLAGVLPGALRKARPGELVGFHFPDRLRREIEAVDLARVDLPTKTRVAVVESAGSRGASELLAALEAAGAPPLRRATEARGAWNDARQIEELFLPGDALRAITDLLEAKA